MGNINQNASLFMFFNISIITVVFVFNRIGKEHAKKVEDKKENKETEYNPPLYRYDSISTGTLPFDPVTKKKGVQITE